MVLFQGAFDPVISNKRNDHVDFGGWFTRQPLNNLSNADFELSKFCRSKMF